MAAPSGIKWGSVVGDYGKIGIYTTTSSTNTETTVTVQVWFASKYSVSDNKGNALYLDVLETTGSATTSYGGTNIQTTVATGSGWSTANHVLLTGKSYKFTHARGHSEATRYIYAKLTNVDRVGGTMYASTTVSIPALSSYSVTYNANCTDASNMPANQTKWYGESIQLQHGPSRANYTFKGWATSASATTATYDPGDNYTGNANLTLYAVWELAYTKPRIMNFRVFRCNEETGKPDDSGTSLGYSFDWEADRNVQSIILSWTPSTGSDNTFDAMLADDCDGPSGESYMSCAVSGFSLETTYKFTLTVRDGTGDCYSVAFATLSGANYAIDFKPPSGNEPGGVAFGKPAELSGVLDVDLKAYFRKGLVPVVLPPETDLDTVTDPNTYVGANLTEYEYSCTSSGLPFTTGSFSLDVSAMGDTGQIKQRITYCHKTASRVWERLYHSTDGVMSWGDWVCVSDFDGQLLWQGGWYMSASQTANLNERVSKQRSGIVLVFSEYEGGVQDYGFTTFYIPKYMVAKYSNNTYNFVMSGGLFYHMACKTIVITDTQIIGHDFNIGTGTGDTGIVYDNKKFVLRYVIGI